MPRLPKPRPDQAAITAHLLAMPERVRGMMDERARWLCWCACLLPPSVIFPLVWPWPPLRFVFGDFWMLCAAWFGLFSLLMFPLLGWLRFRLELREAVLRARYGYWRGLGPFKS